MYFSRKYDVVPALPACDPTHSVLLKRRCKWTSVQSINQIHDKYPFQTCTQVFDPVLHRITAQNASGQNRWGTDVSLSDKFEIMLHTSTVAGSIRWTMSKLIFAQEC